MRLTRGGGQAVGVDCGIARPRPMVQLNPSLDGGGRSDRGHGHRPWIDLATGRTAPSTVLSKGCVGHRKWHLDTSMSRRRQFSAVYGQLLKMSQTLSPSRSTCEHGRSRMDSSVASLLALAALRRHFVCPGLAMCTVHCGRLASCQRKRDTWGFVLRAFASLLEPMAFACGTSSIYR